MSQNLFSFADFSFEILHSLVKDNDPMSLRRMIENGASIQHKDSKGWNLLHHACQLNHTECLPILVTDKACINELNHEKQTPIDIAIQQHHWKAVELLLMHGDLQTQLHARRTLASNIRIYKAAKHSCLYIIQNLIALNCNIDEPCSMENTALHYAAKNKQHQLMTYLIQHHAKLDQQNLLGETPLHISIKKGDVLGVKSLLRYHANLFIRNAEGLSAFRLGLESQNAEIKQLVKGKFLSRLRESNKKFFNIERTRNPDVHTLGKEFNETMQGHQENPIDIPVLPLRSIISAHMMPYQKALYQIDEDMKFFADIKGKDTLMAKTFDWSNDGVEGTSLASSAWPRFSIYIFGTPIKFQVKPLASQIANLFISGLGSYGREKDNDILPMLDFFIDAPEEGTKRLKEKKLANLILNAFHSGEPITKRSLIHAQILKQVIYKSGSTKTPLRLLNKIDKEQSEQVERLNKFIYLIGVIETHRRLYPFLDSTKNQVIPELPMGIAIAMGLKLIAINALSFEQVFGKDPKNFGPFTDDQINSSKGIETFNQKMSALLELYYQHFPQQHFTQEGMHTLLKDTFGGEEDTDGEEYLSEDEEPIQSFSDDYLKSKNSHFQTHLHRAVIKDDIQKVKALLESPIDIDAQDDQGKTALHYAVEKNFVDIVKLLLEHEADLDVHDDNYNYPLFYAITKDFILVQELLKAFNAQQQQVDDIDSKIIFNVDKYGKSVFHNAVSDGDRRMFFKILKHPRLNIESGNSHGQTALHLAAIHYQLEFARNLLKNGANPSARDYSLKTPLYYAQKNKHKRMIRLLIANGAVREISGDEESDDEVVDLTSSEQTNTSMSSLDI
jgi:ankyrin repeat protein